VIDAPDTRFAESSLGRIAYQVVGDGGVDLIVNKGFVPIDLMWYEPSIVHVLTRLSSFSRAIVFDQLGVGSSDRVTHVEGRLLETVCDSMVAVLDHVGCDIVTALGVNAQAPLLFAATHPDRLAALILVNITARQRAAVDYPEGASNEVMESNLMFWQQGWESEAFLRRFAPSAANNPEFAHWFGRCERLSGSHEDRMARLRDQQDMDLRHVLPTIRVPTLAVYRRNARPVGQYRYVAQHISGAKQVEVDGEDVFAWVGDTDPILDAIEEFVTGELPAHETDRVLATVLFTDLVGSTEHAARLGDRRWKELLTSHDRVVDREIERHRGRRITSTGDGVLATFDGPGRAVRCACAVHEAVRSFGIEIRAGVHTGEIELRGGDVAGMAVHIGARVAALAGPREVLVSRTVKDLVVGSGINFEDRGEHELKGVPGSWRLYRVVT
jgi:class 3 adenylate cyclase